MGAPGVMGGLILIVGALFGLFAVLAAIARRRDERQLEERGGIAIDSETGGAVWLSPNIIVQPHQRRDVLMAPDGAFRLVGLELSDKLVAPYFDVHSIRVRGRELLAEPVGGEAFRSDGAGVDLGRKWLLPGDMVSLTVENHTAEARQFVATFVGSVRGSRP